MSEAADAAKEQWQDETLTRLEPLLDRYARSINLSRNSMGMMDLEDALLALIRHPMSHFQPDHLLVAIAGIESKIRGAHGAMTLMPDPPLDQKEIQVALDYAKQQGLNDTVAWLTESFSTGLDLEPLLRELHERFFPPTAPVARSQ